MSWEQLSGRFAQKGRMGCQGWETEDSNVEGDKAAPQPYTKQWKEKEGENRGQTTVLEVDLKVKVIRGLNMQCCAICRPKCADGDASGSCVG